MKFKKGQKVFIYNTSEFDINFVIKSKIMDFDFAKKEYRLSKMGTLYAYRLESEIFLTEKKAIKAYIEYLEEERELQIDFINSKFIDFINSKFLALGQIRRQITYCKTLNNNKIKND